MDIIKMDVTGMGYECGRFIAANVKALGGGRMTTLTCYGTRGGG